MVKSNTNQGKEMSNTMDTVSQLAGNAAAKRLIRFCEKQGFRPLRVTVNFYGLEVQLGAVKVDGRRRPESATASVAYRKPLRVVVRNRGGETTHVVKTDGTHYRLDGLRHTLIP